MRFKLPILCLLEITDVVQILLISVHLPKTAGSSFRASLKLHFGDSMALDYADRPLNHPPLIRNAIALKGSIQALRSNHSNDASIACVHGHFMPVKYRWLRTPERKKFAVWLRDPIERLASHYCYWLKDYNSETAGSLRVRVVEEAWSLERFCFSKEMQNLYCKFFWGFPISRFNFVGITENYESDLSYFSTSVLGSPLSVEVSNVNPQKTGGYYIEDKNLRSRLEHFHKKDMQLYWAALRASNNRK